MAIVYTVQLFVVTCIIIEVNEFFPTLLVGDSSNTITPPLGASHTGFIFGQSLLLPPVSTVPW